MPFLVFCAIEMSFGTQEFWDNWYKNTLEESPNETLEWYLNYDDLKDYISSSIRKDDRVLIVGCGNSLLGNFRNDFVDILNDSHQGEHMSQNGFTGSIVNIDYSDTIIEFMNNRKLKSHNNEYICCDARDMKKVTIFSKSNS